MCTFHPQVQHLENKYDVLTETSTRTHTNKYVYLLKQVRVLTETSTTYTLITCILHYSLPKHIGLFETVARSLKGQVKLVLLWDFAKCGNRKALRLKAQGVYSCK